MRNRALLAVVLIVTALAGSAAYAQFPPRGDDTTTSLGSFRVNIATRFQPLFANCPLPLYNIKTNVLQSPTLNDLGTIIGRSDPLIDGSTGNNSDVGGVFVGTANTVVSEGMLIPPPAFGFGAGTREVHTEVRSLHMTAGGAAVRAGIWYNSPTGTNQTPTRISPGEVESKSGPGGQPQNDFPASSFFDVFVQVDIPPCADFPGATFYNIMPLIVKNDNLQGFPPKVSYLHDSSSIVPILFLNADTANPPRWNRDDIFGYFLLAGHGVGVAQGDFETFMQGQPDAACPFVPPIPSPSPTPIPSPSPTPRPSGTKTTNQAPAARR
jgi:hypothetical protein